jgi:hypothetical protein
MLNLHNNIIADDDCVYRCNWFHQIKFANYCGLVCVSVILSEICGSPSNVSKHCRLIRTET